MELYWNQLLRDMQATGEFHASGLDVTTLARDYSNDQAVLRHDGQKITAYGALEATKSAGWFEIRRLFVAPHLQGNGVLWSVVYEIMSKAPRHAGLFLITKNPAVMHVAKQREFEQVTRVTMPEVAVWAYEVGLSNRKGPGRLPTTALRKQPPTAPKPEERWLFRKA